MKHLLPLLALCVAPAAAQDEPFDESFFAPAAETGAYDGLLGHWTGAGTVQLAPDAEVLPWRATVAFERVLDGHFVEETMNVNVEGMGDLTFRRWRGYDREAGVHRALGLSSMGPGSDETVYWPDASTLLTATAMKSEGQIVTERAIWSIGPETLTLGGTRAIGAGTPYTYLDGKFRRATDDQAVTVEAAAPTPATLGGEMARLAPMVGKWTLGGKMMPMPGMPQVPLQGTETITIGPGGTHTVHHIVGSAGEGPTYEAWAGTYWDPATESYELVMADNMGGIESSRGRFVDDSTVVFISSGTLMGTPKTVRTTMHLADGGIQRVTSDICFGATGAVRNFDATYTRAR